MGTRHNVDYVQRRLDRLREEYDPVVDRERREVDREAFDELAGYAAADGYTGGGYAWVVREEPKPLSETMPDVDEAYPRVLLGLGRGDDGWGPTGGGREAGETYEEAAVREVEEETGVVCEIEDCRRADHVTFVTADSDDEVHTLWVEFLARDAGGGIDVLEAELNGAAWFHELPPNLHWVTEQHPFDWSEWEG